MAEVELNSFITKLKSLWKLGITASLNIVTEGGKASVCLNADLGYTHPPNISQRPQSSRQRRGPAYFRRQERRRQEANSNVMDTVERCGDAETAVEESTTAGTTQSVDVTEQVTEVSNNGAQNAVPKSDDRRNTITELMQTIRDLEKEIETKNETIAVNEMLHDDFKERVKDKYLYSSNDELSDYISDEERRELGRQEFWKNKLNARNNLRCVDSQKCI